MGGSARTRFARLTRPLGLHGDAALLAAAAAAVYVLESVAWPLEGGRDDLNYWLYFNDMWSDRPSFAMMLAYRTPLPSLLFGPILTWAGPWLAEIVLGVMYVGAILAMYRTGSLWGRRVGIGAAVALLAYLPYGALFHTAASDAPFAFATMVWIAYVVASLQTPTLTRFAVAGVGLATIVLIRPGGQTYAVFALFALLLPRLSLRARCARAGVLLATAAIILGGWATFNHFRFDDFTVSRGTGAITPFYRLWAENLVKPENGPASAELAAAVREDLLPVEPYRSFGIDEKSFFASASGRAWEDLVTLSDRRWGWDDDYSVLARASREAIRAHPRTYLTSTLQSVRSYLTTTYNPYTPVPPRRRNAPTPAAPFIPPDAQRPLPKPSDDIVPIARFPWLTSSPDRRVDVDWSTGTRVLTFADPALGRRYEHVAARAQELRDTMPDRNYWHPLTGVLGTLSTLYPNMLVWLLLGLAGVALRRPGRTPVLLSLPGLALLVVVVVALGLPTIYAYRLPVDPLFILFGTVGFLAEDGRYSGRDGERRRADDT